jgi:hypothetical protein
MVQALIMRGYQFQLLDQITGEIQTLKFNLVLSHIQTFPKIANHPTLLHLQVDKFKKIKFISDGKIIKTIETKIDNLEIDFIKIEIKLIKNNYFLIS